MPNSPNFDGYRVTRAAIARGGSGVVHDAMSADGRRVAIKVLDRQSIRTKLEDFYRRQPTRLQMEGSSVEEEVGRSYDLNIDRFKEEYRLLTGLSHPNIAQVEKIGFADGSFYIASEFIDGDPIVKHVRGMKPKDMIPLFIQALEGLDYIHRNGLVHMDLKSENILVHEPTGQSQAKIIDFGLAMSPGEYSGGFMGSVSYMAPEVVLGRKEFVDQRSDLFSFAVVMYKCLSWGQAPFARPAKGTREAVQKAVEMEEGRKLAPPSAAHSHKPGFVPEFLDTIVMRLLAHDPKDRFYGNARAVINALLSHMPDAFAQSSEGRGGYLVPEGDAHIGRDEALAKLIKSVDDLTGRPHKQGPVFVIEGARGFGKSHLLKKIADHAGLSSDRLCVHHISLPADGSVISSFVDMASFALAENARPAVFLIDGVEVLHEAEGAEAVTALLNFMKRTAALMYDRRTKPDLFSEVQPVMMCTTGNVSRIIETLPRNLETISLSPLTYLDIDTYLKSTPALKGRELPRERVDEIYHQTGGIPGEIRELLRDVDAKGLLFNLEGDVLFSLPERTRQKIPSSTEERLLATCESLDAADRRILDVMSVWSCERLAPPVGFNDLFHFMPVGNLRQLLINLSSRGIISASADGDSYAFADPDFFPSLIYRHMDSEERTGWHGRIWRYLKNRNSLPVTRDSQSEKGQVCHCEARQSSGRGNPGGSSVTNHESRITSHDLVLLHRAHMEPCTETYRAAMTLASRRMRSKGDVGLAKRLYTGMQKITRAQRLGLHAAIGLKLAEAVLQEGSYDKARSIAVDALNLLEGVSKYTGLNAALHHVIAVTDIRQRRFDEARKHLHRLATRYCISKNKRQSAADLQFLNTCARWLYERGKVEPAMRHMVERSAGLYEMTSRFEKGIGTVSRNNDLGLVRMSMGEYAEACDLLEMQVSNYERIGDYFGVLQTRMALADALRFGGKYKKAVRIADNLISMSGDGQKGVWPMYAHQTMAYAYHDMDKFDKAIEEDDRWYAASAAFEGDADHKRTAFKVWNHKGHSYKELERWDRAKVCFQAVLEAGPDDFSQMYASAGMGEVCFYTKDYENAIAHLENSWVQLDKISRSLGDAYRFPVGLLLARALHAAKRCDGAKSYLDAIEPLSRSKSKWQSEFNDIKNAIDV